MVDWSKARFKYDYCKEPREQVTTTINKRILKDFTKLSQNIGQPKTKMYDIAIEMILEDEKLLKKFITKVKQY